MTDIETTERKNLYCVISKVADENGWRDLQTNSAWIENPYGEAFAVVPYDMIEDIMKTHGFCNITLSEDGTEVVAFEATEIPAFEDVEEEAEPTTEELLNALLGVD